MTQTLKPFDTQCLKCTSFQMIEWDKTMWTIATRLIKNHFHETHQLKIGVYYYNVLFKMEEKKVSNENGSSFFVHQINKQTKIIKSSITKCIDQEEIWIRFTKGKKIWEQKKMRTKMNRLCDTTTTREEQFAFISKKNWFREGSEKKN